MLKMIEVQLDLISKVAMYLFLENGISMLMILIFGNNTRKEKNRYLLSNDLKNMTNIICTRGKNVKTSPNSLI